jgi:type IV fimbrial biogenesis protein FimT
MRYRFSTSSGFTLVELMVVIIMASILVAVAIPSFRTLIVKTRVVTAVNGLVSSLNLARSEAIKRGQRVTVCTSSDGATCDPNVDWDRGWIVFDEVAPPNATVDAGETVISVHDGLDPQFTLVGNGNVADYVSFANNGATQQVPGGNQMGTISLCGSGLANEDRDIVINVVGRISLRQTTCP